MRLLPRAPRRARRPGGAPRLPGRANPHREGQARALNRGPITELSIDIDGRVFRARVKNESLEVPPPVELAAWVDLLLTQLSDAAAGNHNLRRAVLRSGWALR